MVNNEHRAVAVAALRVVQSLSGKTYNDGGSWNTWVYEMPDGTFTKVHQPTDYRPEIEITKVQRKERTVVTYE